MEWTTAQKRLPADLMRTQLGTWLHKLTQFGSKGKGFLLTYNTKVRSGTGIRQGRFRLCHSNSSPSLYLLWFSPVLAPFPDRLSLHVELKVALNDLKKRGRTPSSDSLKEHRWITSPSWSHHCEQEERTRWPDRGLGPGSVPGPHRRQGPSQIPLVGNRARRQER